MRLTLRRLKGLFLKWACDALAPATVAAYKHQLAKIPPRVERKEVNRLRPVDLSSWAKSWHESQAVVRLLNWAQREARLIRSNPLSRCKHPTRGQRRRVLAMASLQRMMRTGRRSSREFVLALRETAARPQEIRAAAFEQLQSEDFNIPIADALERGQAVIVQHDYKDRRRRSDATSPRVLIISRRLGRLITRIARRRGVWSGPIFLNNRGRAWSKNAVRCLFRRVRKRLAIVADANGENVVAYTFRHSVATNAVIRGLHGRLLADWLGHVDERTTKRYVHLRIGHIRNALENLRPHRAIVQQDTTRTL